MVAVITLVFSVEWSNYNNGRPSWFISIRSLKDDYQHYPERHIQGRSFILESLKRWEL